MPSVRIYFDTAMVYVPCFTSSTGAWSFTDQALVQDDSGALSPALDEGETSAFLGLSGASTAPPADSTITGIVVTVRGRSTEGSCIGDAVQLIKAGACSDDLGERGVYGSDWELHPSGSSTELWGETWTPEDFGADFGVAFSCAGFAATPPGLTDLMEVDVIYCDVYYQLCRRSRMRQPRGCCDCNTCAPPDCDLINRSFDRSDTTNLGSSFDEVSGDSYISGNKLHIPDGGEVQCTRVASSGTAYGSVTSLGIEIDDGETAEIYLADGDAAARITRDGDDVTLDLATSGSVTDTQTVSIVGPVDLIVCSDGTVVSAVASGDGSDVAIVSEIVDVSTGTHAGMKASGGEVTFQNFRFRLIGDNCGRCYVQCGGCQGPAPGRWLIEIAGIVGRADPDAFCCADRTNGSFAVEFAPTPFFDGCRYILAPPRLDCGSDDGHVLQIDFRISNPGLAAVVLECNVYEHIGTDTFAIADFKLTIEEPTIDCMDVYELPLIFADPLSSCDGSLATCTARGLAD